MKTILITNKYGYEPKEIIRSVIGDGFYAVFLEENTKECLMEKMPEADYVLASGRVRIDGDVLEKADRLRMVQRTGSGLDSLDLEELKKRSIPVYVNSGINSRSVAEYTLLMILGCLRRVPMIDRNTKNGVWKKQEQGVHTRELYGKTVGLIGFGNIGKKVAQMLIPFGTKTIYYCRERKDKKTESEYQVTYSNLDKLLEESDIISVHCPLNDETKGMLGKHEFGLMKKDAILINTARGQIVDMDSLTESLKEGRLAFAGIDVYDTEPVRKDSGILQLDNVMLSPHIAGVTYESFFNMMESAIRNIRCFDSGSIDEIKQYRVV